MYLLKYLAHCGICSRRKAAELIKQGLVKVNGQVVTMPFSQTKEGDLVTYKGKVVKPQKHVYVLLNKPKGYLTTCSDERGRKTVMELVKDASKNRLYPVGRLDRDSTGLLLFTNDGKLAQKLSHPSGNVPKVYRVLLDKQLLKQDLQKIQNGITLEDGFLEVDRCNYNTPKNKYDIIIQIHSGRYRIIRRMFKHLGYKVEKLDRVEYAGLTKQNLSRGAWRFLTKDEITQLLR